MSRKPLFPLILLFGVAAASAAAWPPELQGCAAQKDAGARLACYDRAAAAAGLATPATTPARGSAAVSDPAAAPSAPATAAPLPAAPGARKDPSTDPDYGLNGAALRRKQRDRGDVPEAVKPQPLTARVVNVARIGQAEVTVTLDNGQVWKQTDGAGNLSIAPRDSVTITPASLGGFFLTCADRRVIHVKRLQ